MTHYLQVTCSLSFIIYILLNYPVTSIHSINTVDNYSMNGKIIRTPGEFVLGGIFPMHEHRSSNRDYPCGAIKEEKGIQRLEAMFYAIDEINRDDKLLPNITLGIVVIDSCSSDTYALEQSMEFVRYYMNKVSETREHCHLCMCIVARYSPMICTSLILILRQFHVGNILLFNIELS